jgi:hypothetical protein
VKKKDKLVFLLLKKNAQKDVADLALASANKEINELLKEKSTMLKEKYTTLSNCKRKCGDEQCAKAKRPREGPF